MIGRFPAAIIGWWISIMYIRNTITNIINYSISPFLPQPLIRDALLLEDRTREPMLLI